MRFSRPPLTAVLLAAAFSAGNPAGAVPVSPLLVNVQPGRAAAHRRAGSGPGTKAFQRAATKRRNVQRNRRNHRG